MKQQCHMAMIYFTWVFYLGGLAYLLYRSMWPMAIAWLVCIPLFEWLYIRQFRGLSQLLGYGRIVDQPVSYTHLDVYKRQASWCSGLVAAW